MNDSAENETASWCLLEWTLGHWWCLVSVFLATMCVWNHFTCWHLHFLDWEQGFPRYVLSQKSQKTRSTVLVLRSPLCRPILAITMEQDSLICWVFVWMIAFRFFVKYFAVLLGYLSVIFENQTIFSLTSLTCCFLRDCRQDFGFFCKTTPTSSAKIWQNVSAFWEPHTWFRQKDFWSLLVYRYSPLSPPHWGL